jgi:hypothetical protein
MVRCTALFVTVMVVRTVAKNDERFGCELSS